MLLGASGDERTSLCIDFSCPFTTRIKNCPEFKYLMFFLISHSWHVSVQCGFLPTCPMPPSPRVTRKESHNVRSCFGLGIHQHLPRRWAAL